MSIKSILSCTYVPNDIMNYVQNNPNVDTIHFYIDLKNSSTGLFVPDIVQDIVSNNGIMKKGFDSTIFQSILLTISNWKYWCSQRNLKLKIFIANDMGKSEYHLTLEKEYKANRKITNVILESCKEEMDEIKAKNWNFSEDVCNSLNDVYYINLKFIESDFIPYYLIKKYFNNMSNVLHILSSNDKDHFQFLNLPNTVMFFKRMGNHVVLNKNKFLNKFVNYLTLPFDKQPLWTKIIDSIDPEHIVNIMSLVGDAVDDVPGIKGIGNKTAVKLFSEKEIVEKIFGTPQESLQRVLEGKELAIQDSIPLSKLSNKWKNVVINNNVITNAYKLISYDCLINWLEKKDTVHKVETLDKIDGIINKPNKKFNKEYVIKFYEMMNNLEDLQLTKIDIVNLFRS